MMIDMDNSSYNGWFFEKMTNGNGTGKCEKCGKEITVTTKTCLNLKECDCNEGNKK